MDASIAAALTGSPLRQAYGFRTADALRTMIDLRCTGLLIPLPHHP